jgi:hypothetical protein
MIISTRSVEDKARKHNVVLLEFLERSRVVDTDDSIRSCSKYTCMISGSPAPPSLSSSSSNNSGMNQTDCFFCLLDDEEKVLISILFLTRLANVIVWPY